MVGSRPAPCEKEQSPAGTQTRVLLIEDDQEMRAMLADVLRAEGYSVDEYTSGLPFLDVLSAPANRLEGLRRWQAIISDVRMPGLSGLTILGIAKLWACEDCPPVIIITAFGDEETYAEAERLGVAAVLDKPFELDDLIAAVQSVAPPRPARG